MYITNYLLQVITQQEYKRKIKGDSRTQVCISNWEEDERHVSPLSRQILEQIGAFLRNDWCWNINQYFPRVSLYV